MAMPHLPQIRTDHAPRSPIIDLDARHSLVPLARVDDRHRRALSDLDVPVRESDRIHQDAVDALLLQVLYVLELFLDGKMADEQDALVASRVEDAIDSRQQLANRHGVHAWQDDADELALLRLEPLGEEVRLEPRFLDGLAHPLLLLQADVAVIEVARDRAL